MYIKVIPSALLLLELVSLAIAAPSSTEKRSFKIERVRNERFTGLNGPRELARAYRKHGMTLPPALVNAIATQEQPTVKLAKRRNIWQHSAGQAPEGFGVENAVAGSNSEVAAAGDAGGQEGDEAGQAAGENNAQDDAGASVIDAVGKAGKGNGNGTGTGKVANEPEPNDIEYLSEIKIGGQTVNMVIDTGSSDLWVFNTQLSAAQTNGHAIFDPAKSKTFKSMKGAQFAVRYGDGSRVSGNVGNDVVDVGGALVPNQAIELATSVSDSFVQKSDISGLMGLGFQSLNTVQPNKQKTFFENVLPSLAEPVFTADLRHNAPGAYEFGRIDTSKFVGSMAWIPVDPSQGLWQFGSESFAIGGGQPQQATKGGQAIADTGTTLLLADPKIVNAYYAQVQGAENSQEQGGILFPCNATLPDLDLDIGGVYMARIKAQDLNLGFIGNGRKLLSSQRKYLLSIACFLQSLHPFLCSSQLTEFIVECFGGLQVTGGDGLGVYGDIFFKSQFVAFNGGNNSLGMALHA